MEGAYRVDGGYRVVGGHLYDWRERVGNNEIVKRYIKEIIQPMFGIIIIAYIDI